MVGMGTALAADGRRGWRREPRGRRRPLGAATTNMWIRPLGMRWQPANFSAQLVSCYILIDIILFLCDFSCYSRSKWLVNNQNINFFTPSLLPLNRLIFLYISSAVPQFHWHWNQLGFEPRIVRNAELETNRIHTVPSILKYKTRFIFSEKY